MEMNKEMPAAEVPMHGWYGRCGRGTWGRCLVRTLVLVLVFLLGMAAGAMCARHRGFMQMRGGMMGRGMTTMNSGMMMPAMGMKGEMMGMMHDGNMMMGMPGMMSASGTTAFVGSITKIEGNRVTILDNAAREQVILSQASTTIMSTMGTMSLSSLRVGQTIRGMGMVGADMAITAVTIQML